MTRFALVLGALSALGPVAIDMYLPALPSIARDLHAPQGQVEMSLMTFFIGITVGQLFYGPLSDRFGRRAPILLGLTIYSLASIACSLSPNVSTLIWGRLFQGIGAGGGWAIGSAIVRDLYTGHKAARLMALRMAVLGISPILSPLLGAAIIAAAPWRAVFWVATAFGIICMALLFAIPETRPAEVRHGSRLSDAFGVYGRLLTDRRFISVVLAAGLVQGGFIAYIAGSSFVFITMNGASPFLYSVIFGTNAIGFIGGAQFVPQLMRRYPPQRLIVTGMTIQAVFGVAMLAAALTHHATVAVLAPLLFFYLACTGLIGGPSTILALRDQGHVAGTASALMGFLQSAAGALGSALVAQFANGTALPMTGVIVGGSLSALLFARIAFANRAPSLAPAPADAAS